jgi:hypothetical protein
MVSPRVRAVWDLSIPEIREYAGVHSYDGAVMDLSPSGMAAGLAQLGDGLAEPNAHDEAHLAAIEESLRASFVTAEMHRWNPLVHMANLDLAVYDREYAPAAEREAAKRRHLDQWPDAIDAALESLDAIPSPVARALRGSIGGLATGVEDERALAAHARLCERVDEAVASGSPDSGLGTATLEHLLAGSESLPIDLGRLEARADTERDRLMSHLTEDCNRYKPGSSPAELIPELVADHPDDEGIYEAARLLVDEVTSFTLERDLLPELGGTCRVGPAPESRRMAMAMMSWTGAYEQEAPAWYYVNPPDPSWDDESKEEWRSVFSATTLPAITVHEVTPGHFAHGRMILRIKSGDVRRSLCSQAFVEGWAHYTEELMVEAGFRESDPRFAIGVWIEALVRVTRLAAALGVHRGTMSVDEATRRFETDAFLRGPAAVSEAVRATFDPTYGRYTWGKLEILALRDEAIAAWGTKFSLRRFHEAILGLGAPPLGTMGDAIGD